MKNIRRHAITIPSTVADRSWRILQKRYQEIESGLVVTPTFVDSALQRHMHSTGAFQLSRREIGRIGRNRTLTYLVAGDSNKLCVQLKTKTIFRGLDYFAGLQRISNSEKSGIIFRRLNEMLSLLSETEQAETNLILHLVLLDYVRNYLILVLYAIHTLYKEKHPSRDAEGSYSELLRLIRRVEYRFVEALINKLPEPLEVTEANIAAIETFRLHIERSLGDNSTYRSHPDIFRKVRECNNPAKLLHFGRSVADLYIPRATLLIGLEYGGMELPYIVNACRHAGGKGELDAITVRISNYSARDSMLIDMLEDILPPFFSSQRIAKYTTAILLDDSIVTGRTIDQLVHLLPETITDIYLCVASFTNSNRYHHVARYGHGGVAPQVLSNSLVLYKSNFASTYTKRTYTNRRGTFDKEKASIKRMLAKHYAEAID